MADTADTADTAAMAVTAVTAEAIVHEAGTKEKKTKVKAAPRAGVQAGISTERRNSVSLD
ncbi:MAG: hypothetical protein ACSLFK_08140 [Gemmatimonadaceae bacterium]